MANEVEPLYRDIGSKIQELRNSQDMTQRTLGQLLDPPATRASIANIENGKQRVLVHTLLQIARILDVGLDKILPDIKERSDSHMAKAMKKELKQKFSASQVKKIENLIRATEDAA